MSDFAVRDLTKADIPALMVIVRENGFPERSQKGWEWAMFHSPEQGDVAPGLVAVKNGDIVAFMGAQVRWVHRGAEKRRVITGHTFISLAIGRGAGLRVLKRLLKHPSADALLTINNNAVSSPLLARVGLEPVLGDAGRFWCDWPLRPIRRLVGRGMSFLARSERFYRLFQAREWFDRSKAERWMVGGDGTCRQIYADHPEDIALIEQFAADYATENPDQFLPERTAEAYQWRMSDPDFPDRSLFLGAFEGGRLVSLMMATMCKPNSHEPWVAYLTEYASLLCADEGGQTAKLLAAVGAAAKHRGAAILRIRPSVAMPDSVRAQSGRHVMKSTDYDSSYISYRENGEVLRETFQPGPFDSDLIHALRGPTPK